MTPRKVIIIGAGASGLMAAIAASEAGADTLVLEKTSRIAQKLRLTGGGHCNVTHMCDGEVLLRNYEAGHTLLRHCFRQMPPKLLIERLQKLAVPTRVEADGRVLPASGRSEDVISALATCATAHGVTFRTLVSVHTLWADDGNIGGVLAKSNAGQETIDADAVIICTGGASYPGTGASGDGYQLAQSVGHAIVDVRPALVPLVTEGELAGSLQGVSLTDVSVILKTQDKTIRERCGEMVFTHYGVSGPAVLSVSRCAVDLLRQKAPVTLSIDLLPHLEHKQLDSMLVTLFRQHGKQSVSNVLRALGIPYRVCQACASIAEIGLGQPGHQVSADQRKRLRLVLKGLRFDLAGHRPIAEAIVTAGGVDCKQVNPRTLQSRLVGGLYFAGEVLDIDGDTGGFNLQAAFATGYVAGTAAAANQRSSR